MNSDAFEHWPMPPDAVADQFDVSQSLAYGRFRLSDARAG
jgi:hypothetical protein